MEKDDVVELGIRIERLEKKLDQIVNILSAYDDAWKAKAVEDYWALRKQAEQGL